MIYESEYIGYTRVVFVAHVTRAQTLTANIETELCNILSNVVKFVVPTQQLANHIQSEAEEAIVEIGRFG